MSTTTATDTTPSKAHVIRTLAKSLREYRTASLLSPLFVIVEAVIEIAIPTVIAHHYLSINPDKSRLIPINLD